MQKYADLVGLQKDYPYLQGYKTLKMSGGIPLVLRNLYLTLFVDMNNFVPLQK